MKKWLVGILIALLVVLGIVLYNINDTVNKETIYAGISIEDMDMTGKTKEEAIEVIKSIKQSEIKKQSMNLKGMDKEYTIGLEEIAFDYDYQEAADIAYGLGREGNLFERYKKIKEIEKNNKKIELKSHYKSENIAQKAEIIAKEIDREVVDSKFDFNGGNFNISDEVIGYKVDEKQLASKIEENIYKLEAIEIPINTIEPKYTKEYYSKINGIIGSSSTSFKTSGPGRVSNVQLSARAFNGKILHPGENLSYNSTLGPITTKAGYKDAPVIVAGDLQPGVGGGICQTSTTLYNALLRADLTVTERSHHSIPSAYMEKGLDAVVAGNYLDLKFRNDFDYPIYISSRTVGKTVYFDIYGDKKNRDYTIQMEAKILKVIPHKVREIVKNDMKPGSRKVEQQGRNGYKVATYKHKIKNGKVIETKQVSSDYYKEREGIIHIGPKVQAPVEVPPVETQQEDPVVAPTI